MTVAAAPAALPQIEIDASSKRSTSMSVGFLMSCEAGDAGSPAGVSLDNVAWDGSVPAPGFEFVRQLSRVLALRWCWCLAEQLSMVAFFTHLVWTVPWIINALLHKSY